MVKGISPIIVCVKGVLPYFTIIYGNTHDKSTGPNTLDSGDIAPAVFQERAEGDFPMFVGQTIGFPDFRCKGLIQCDWIAKWGAF